MYSLRESSSQAPEKRHRTSFWKIKDGQLDRMRPWMKGGRMLKIGITQEQMRATETTLLQSAVEITT